MSAPINLNRLAYFAAVVDAGSFTHAAERLGITKAVVSHQVLQLENDLQTTLLVRTTRRVQPTEAGRLFHARCLLILREAEDAFAELAAGEAAPTGTLRLTAPTDYGVNTVVPVVTQFTARYPDCRVEVRLGDQTLDLVRDQMDMAIRVGWLEDSSAQARKIGSFRQLLVGSAGFMGRIGVLDRPERLEAVAFVANLALRRPHSFAFTQDHAVIEVNFRSALAIDTTLGVLAAVQQGGGLSVLPEFLVDRLIASGELLHVLPDWSLPSGGIHAVFPAARFRPTKVTAFVEMLRAAEQAKTMSRLSVG